MKNLLSSFLLIVILSSCSSSKINSEQLNGSWQLTSIQDSQKSIGELFKTTQPFIAFSSLEKRVSGTNGCNRFGATYEVKGNKLTLSPLIATKMACQDVDESIFMENITKVDKFMITDEGKTLNLANGDHMIMSFKRLK